MRKKNIFCAFLFLGQTFLALAQVKIVFKTAKIPASKVAAEHLFLAGDFNKWNPADKAWELRRESAGIFVLSRELPRGSYGFKITRGSWETVECTVKGKPVDNRNVKVTNDTTIMMNVENWQDNFAVAARKHTASARVHIISDKFEMPQLGRQRRVWIYLPRDYDQTHERYPVIYMHDGQNLFDEYTAGFGEWGIDELMDNMPAAQECIVVGIDHGGDYRITEYDPFDSKYGKGRGADYTDFLVKTLKPFIDSHYKTKKDVQHTTIAGSSMGGLISMYAALKYPDVFGNAGIFSPAFWIAPDLYAYAQQQQLKKHSRFYFVCGDAESETMVNDMKKMADLVKAKGVTEEDAPVVVIQGAKHNEKQWNGDFPAFYNWLIKK